MALSTVSVLGLVDHVNHEKQRQQLLGGLLILAADQVKADQFSLDNTQAILPIRLDLTSLANSSLSAIQQARLKDQQYLINSDQEGQLSASTLLNGKVFSGTFDGLSSTHVRGALMLLENMMVRYGVSKTNFSEFALEHNLPVRLVGTEEYEKFPSLSLLTAPAYEAQYQLTDSQGLFYSYFPKINSLVEFGPVVFYQGFSIQAVLVVILMAVILTGIAVYWLVHRFELNLQYLERASTRIASGHLNSRVKVNNPDSFGRLGLAFNRMAEQIQRLMGVQKEMIRAVSHELRTPVARMRFGVQMLEDSTEDSYLQKQLQDMDKDLQELDELVDEILTYARLEEGGPILEFKSANLIELMEKVVEETKRRTDKVAIHWESQVAIEEQQISDIEYRYMHRALQNLVGNACRYAKGNICVSYHFNDDICRIDVEDDGQGIPEKDWGRVFSLFTRLDDSRTRSSGGYGLGLSIVRRIIYWHGGKAIVSRSRWGGAKMSLIWPKNHQG